VICPKCGKDHDPTIRAPELCQDCFSHSGEGEQRAEFDQNSFRTDFHLGRSTGYCPWEDEEGTGFTQGLLQTLRQSIFEPTNFFRRLPLQGGYKFPFLYALVISTISILAAYIASTMVDSRAMPMMMHGMPFMGPNFGSLIYVLLVVILQIFVKPFVLFVCLLALGVRSATLEGTFRISCYSTGPGIFNVVPLLGSLIAGVWEFVILVIGLKEGFGIRTGRTIIAILLPLIVTVALIMLVIMLVIGKLF